MAKATRPTLPFPRPRWWRAVQAWILWAALLIVSRSRVWNLWVYHQGYGSPVSDSEIPKCYYWGSLNLGHWNRQIRLSEGLSLQLLIIFYCTYLFSVWAEVKGHILRGDFLLLLRLNLKTVRLGSRHLIHWAISPVSEYFYLLNYCFMLAKDGLILLPPHPPCWFYRPAFPRLVLHGTVT